MRTNTRQNARRRVEEQDHHHRPKGDGPGRAEQDEADPISDRDPGVIMVDGVLRG